MRQSNEIYHFFTNKFGLNAAVYSYLKNIECLESFQNSQITLQKGNSYNLWVGIYYNEFANKKIYFCCDPVADDEPIIVTENVFGDPEQIFSSPDADEFSASGIEYKVISLPICDKIVVNRSYLSRLGIKKTFGPKFPNSIFMPCTLLQLDNEIGWLIKDLKLASSSNIGFVSLKQNKLLLPEEETRLTGAVIDIPLYRGDLIWKNSCKRLIFDGEQFAYLSYEI